MARVFAALFAVMLAGAAFAQSDAAQKQFREWTVERIGTLTSSRDAAERAKAAEWLGGSKDADAIEALARALTDPEARVRQAAAGALWKSEKASAAAKPALQRALQDPDVNVVAQAAGALASIGVPAGELLEARKRVFASREASIDSRFLVARNLVGQEPAAALLEPMVAFLERSAAVPRDGGRRNVELAEQGLERLAKSKDPAAAAALMEAARASRAAQSPGQASLVKTLAKLDPKPEGYTAFVVGFLDAREPRVKSAALDALRGRTSEAEVALWAPRAAALVRDPDSSVRSNALWLLGEGGGLSAPQVDAVVAALGDPEASVRGNAARALGEMGESRQAVSGSAKARVAEAARPALTAAMEKDPDKDVRERAQYALRQLGGNPAVAAAAAPSAASESGGMALLRQKKITFEEPSFIRALSEADVEVVRAFLDAGMSPKAPLGDLGAPVRVMFFAGAACSAQERPTKPQTKALLKLLLDRGADPNVADGRGNVALMDAATRGCDREVMKMLLKGGANLNAKNFSGLTAFEMGLFSGHDGLEELVAAGYRLPPEKSKAYAQAYAGKPAVQALIQKASRK